MDLEVAIEPVHYADLAAAFTKVTGVPARYSDTDFHEYISENALSVLAQTPIGYNVPANDPTAMLWGDNLKGFWNLWKNSGGNKGVIRRDYKLLDEIHPNRIKTTEEFFRSQGPGLAESILPENQVHILKILEDGFKGSL